jgi:3-phosphoshikimate 1-carboxyvinyltransferase
MKSFRFKGVIPASKSLMNRALIVQSYFPKLKLEGHSQCEDVVHLKKSLRRLKTKRTLHCGEGGTTLRFLAFRASREKGSFLLKGSRRLLSRPQTDIQKVLAQLGVQVQFEKTGLRITSKGWQRPAKPVRVNAKDSSQFLSAIFLNAWNLDFDLQIQVQGNITSESYFQMTLSFLKDLGLRFQRRGTLYVIPKGQQPKAKSYQVESDLSSLFSVAAFAAVSGRAEFQKFPEKSLQPDKEFLNIFKKMKIGVEAKRGLRRVNAPIELKPLKVSLKNSPDLFPVLAALCSFASGRSILYGAPQLVKKESNRIEKTAELLSRAGVQCRIRKDGIVVEGRKVSGDEKSFSFDPDNDHRLAMAAALLKFQGLKIKIKNPRVVNKSFPEFWKFVGVKP